jgi:hypothetical protein
MQIGETVVLVGDVDGMPAGKEGLVMRVRGDMLLIGCRSAHRLEFVLARSWEVLPERKWRRLGERAWALTPYSAEHSRMA